MTGENVEAPIFLVGCPRSGTSLLRDLLRSHPRLSFPPESHWIPTLSRVHGDPSDERAARRLAESILHLDGVRAWQLPITTDDLADCRSYAELVARLYRAWAAREGKSRWGDKTPQYATEIPTLRRLFPHCQVLHIYRDGRDVARSWMRTSFGPSNLYSAAVGWQRLVRAARRSGATLPASAYLEVRYESLLAQPGETMRAICDFLGEPCTDAVLKPTPISAAFNGTLWQSRRTTPRPAIIDSSNGAKWKHDMARADRALVESVAGRLLAELGYETEGLAHRLAPGRVLYWRLHNGVSSSWRRVWTAYRKGRLAGALKLGLAGLLSRPDSGLK